MKQPKCDMIKMYDKLRAMLSELDEVLAWYSDEICKASENGDKVRHDLMATEEAHYQEVWDGIYEVAENIIHPFWIEV